MLFITHVLRVAAHVSEEIAVMKDGVVVEQAATADIFDEPSHEYTKTLLASVPGGIGSYRSQLRAIEDGNKAYFR